jgi:hypothetical protein
MTLVKGREFDSEEAVICRLETYIQPRFERSGTTLPVCKQQLSGANKKKFVFSGVLFRLGHDDLRI